MPQLKFSISNSKFKSLGASDATKLKFFLKMMFFFVFFFFEKNIEKKKKKKKKRHTKYT